MANDAEEQSRNREPVATVQDGESAANRNKSDKKDDAEESPTVGVFEVFKYAKRTDTILMIVGAVAAFANGAGLPAFSLLFGNIINELAKPGADVEAAIARLALIMTGVGGAVFVLSALQVGLWMISSMRQVHRIRQQFFLSALRQDMAWHDEHKPGALTSMMDGDTRVIMNGINDKLSNGIFQLGMALFGFGIGFFRSWQLTLVMLGTMPFIAAVGTLMSVVMTRLSDRSREGYAKAGEIATELLENSRTVQVFGRVDHDVERFVAALGPAQLAGVKREFASSASVGLTYCVMFGSYAIAFWFASFLIVNGHSNVGDVTGTFFAVLMGSFGVGLLFPSVSAFAEARGAARKVYAVIDRVPPIDVFGGGASISSIRQSLVLRNVTFRYPTRRDQPLLEHFNVVIPRGQRVAFSGPSGCGKSTVIALLQRLYDPDEGAVEVDGVDLRTLDLQQWRDRIGVVSQEPTLFMGSIEENVKIGKPNATHEEVIEACRKAQIHDVVMTLSEGYNTSVGAVGSQLSGGQKQRIAIARAIIRKPEILILDEATSALDRQSEVEVQRTLDSVMRNETGESLTVVVIAHRLATIRGVDRIYFMKTDGVNGSSIVESGSFDELMSKNGQFAAMAALQEASARFETRSEQRTSDNDHQGDEAAMGKESGKTDGAGAKEEEPVPSLRILRMMAPDCGYLLLGLLGSVMTGLIYPAYAVVLTKMLDALTKTENADDIKSNTAIWAPMFVAIGLAALIGWTLHAMYSVAGERLTTQLRKRLLSAALRQEQAYFDMPGHDAGAISGILSGDAEAVHLLWGASLGFKIQSFCNLIAGIVIALIYNWRIALVVLATAPLIVLAGALQQLLLVGFGHEAAEKSEDSLKSEAFSNIRTVTAFNLQRDRFELYNRCVGDVQRKNVGTGLVTGMTFGFSQFALYGVFALGFWYGGKLLQQGDATFEQVLIATMAVLMGAMGAGEAGGFAAKLADSQAASRRVFSVIDRTPLIDADAGGVSVEGVAPTIALQDVTFRYPARPLMPVLRGVNETFAFGREIGLMGQTGCGKSTIIQLLARFYDPEGGAVTVNGVDLRDIDLRQWRDGISIVMQEPALFSGSIRDNILYGRPDASEADVMEAARLAAIHDDILSLPNGYDTEVGYRGRELSGGQKQRVAIARGLIRRPRLLLLDEATSALDNATEARVQHGLAEYRRASAMTTVSVAHRLTTIEGSDVIVVMDQGRVLERGSHKELIAMDGEYKVRYDLYHGSK